MEWVAQSDVDADLARRLIAAQFPEVAFRSITRLGAAHRFREAAGNVLARAPFHPAGLPGDELGRLDHAKRMPLARERFGELVQAGALGDASAFVAFLEEHPAGPPPGARRIVHGDLYARHVLVAYFGMHIQDAVLRECGLAGLRFIRETL